MVSVFNFSLHLLFQKKPSLFTLFVGTGNDKFVLTIITLMLFLRCSSFTLYLHPLSSLKMVRFLSAHLKKIKGAFEKMLEGSTFSEIL